MKLIPLIAAFVIFGLINTNAQESTIYLSGYAKTIYGDAIEEDCSCTPDAITAITARCTNDTGFIEWETCPVPAHIDSKSVTFIWSGGYSTGTKADAGSFSMYINEKQAVSFITASRIEGGDWKAQYESTELSFKNIKSYKRTSGKKRDYWGYFELKSPANELLPGQPVRIKIKGDASGSKYWLRTMEYQLVNKVKSKAENIVNKDETGKLTQRVKIIVENISEPHPIDIICDGKIMTSATLNLGSNDIYITFDAVNSPVDKTIFIKSGNQQEKFRFTLKPVKEIILYLLAHSHVDIGYTELQTEVEKKQWKNIDEGIRLAKQSAGYKNGAAFKWNSEALWAVKSYLENFPEKRESFFDAVRKGWLGLDATYANLLTGLSRPEELYKWLDYSNQLEKMTGIKIESAMISDIPGYTWGTVQAFADNGVKYFSVGTNGSDRLGSTLKTWGDKPFYWKSQSGKDKILIWLAGKGYSWFHTWDLTKEDVSPLLDYLDILEARNYPYDMVQLRYTTDDNGGPNAALPDFIANWNATHVTPLFKMATTEEMFKDFEKKYASVIPTYKGDFTPYWEDGAASTAKETALNRNTAELLTQLEVLYSLKDKEKFPFKDFEEAWKNVLLFSEHTWGAYNSITDPEEKSVKEQWNIKKSFAIKADSIANGLLNNIRFEGVSGDIVENVNVWNSNSWKRSDIVVIPSEIKKKGECLIDESGQKVVTQKLSNGEMVFIAKNIPPFSSKSYRFVETEQVKQLITNSPDGRNKFVNNGIPVNLDSYIDKNYEYSFNGFINTGKNAANPKTNNNIKVISEEQGPVVNSVVYESSAPGCNNLLSEIKTFTGITKTEIINTINKKKVYDKENLRFAFPFNIENPVTRIDIAWSVIKPEKDQLPAANKNYFTVQRWIDISNDKRGIIIAAPDAPFFEIGGMNAEAWTATISNEWEEHAKSSSKLFSWVMNNSWFTNYKAEQEGTAKFRYIFQPHKQFDYSSSYKFGTEQSQPLLITYSKYKNERENVITLDENAKIVVTSLKPSNDGKGYIVRLYNPTDEKCTNTIKYANTIEKVFISNGDEEEMKISSLKIELAPFEVVTLKILAKNK